eukprot:TRINITY_DN20518_c0_g1_i1.p1 TRINITY_DN20518_c0_g1~~TRINITY_DN20518_c0_g1_i1.p1  ORF type:complete len:291 (-),score=56.58 TRINITY_DN20518_c0_g1_i1:44-916(-)
MVSSSTWARVARPLSSALGAVSVVGAWQLKPTSCENAKKPTFQEAKCTQNQFHTKDTRLITLKLPGNWNEKGPVANVSVRATIASPDGATTVGRPYNPLSADSGDSITLLVKKYAGSKMGSHLHALKVGESVQVRGPNVQWAYERGKYCNYAMVAGGTGITPIAQAADRILKDDAAASVTMVTFNKTADDILLRRELTRMQVMYPGRFSVTHVVESSGTSAAADVVEGRATQELLEALLPKPAKGVMVMVCGRKEMTEAVAGAKTPDFKQGEVGGVLKKLGYTSDQVWKF